MKRAIGLLFFLFVGFFSWGQELSSNSYFGLVLSGGGAKGLAHIGMLKALEENGLKVDFVSGSSKGALIGAYYACGFSPDSLQKISLGEDYINSALGETPEKIGFSYTRKLTPQRVFSLRVLKDISGSIKISTARSIIDPLGIDLMMIKNLGTCNALSYKSFDNLFVKFRSVATNITKREMYIPHKGSITNIVRASMTFPFYIPPIKIDGDVMFDGGIMNNFPVSIIDTVFHPPFTIGSNVSSGTRNVDEMDPLNQLQYMITSPTNYAIPKSKGLVVNYELGKYSTFDFQKREEILNIGYRHSAKVLNQNDLYAEHYRKIEKKRNIINASKPPLKFRRVKLNGLKKSQEKFVRNKFFNPKKEFNYDRIENISYHLNSFPIFETIRPNTFFDTTANELKLEFDFTLSKYPVFFLNGLISSDDISSMYGGVEYSLMRNFLNYTKLDVKLGQRDGFFTLQNRTDLHIFLPFYFRYDLGFNSTTFKKKSDFFFRQNTIKFLREDNIYSSIALGFPMLDPLHVEFGVKNFAVKNEYSTEDNISENSNTFENFYERHDDFNGNEYSFLLEYGKINQAYLQEKGGLLSLDVSYKEYRGASIINKIEDNRSEKYLDVEDKYQGFYRARLSGEKYLKIDDFYTLISKFELVFSNAPLYDTYDKTLLILPTYSPDRIHELFFSEIFRAREYFSMSFENQINLYKKWHLNLFFGTFLPNKKLIPVSGKTDLRFGTEYQISEFSFDYLQSIYKIAFEHKNSFAPLSVNFYFTPNTFGNFGASSQKLSGATELREFYILVNFGFLFQSKKIFR